MKYKVRNKTTGEITEIEAGSPQEALTSAASKSITTPTGAPSNPVTTPTTSFAEKILPVGASMLGSNLGPVGTGVGYSIGDSLREIIKQMRAGGSDILAQSKLGQTLFGGGKAAEMTPYGQQKASELGMTAGGVQVKPDLLKQFLQTGQKVSDQPEFSYAQAAGENIQNPENLKAAGKFVAKNVAGSIIAAFTDFAARKATSYVTDKLLPKVNALFKVGGIKPSTINESAKQASEEIWSGIASSLDEAQAAGTNVNVRPIIKEVTNARSAALKGFTEEQVLALPRSNNIRAKYEGFTNVIDKLTDLGGESGLINPNQAQTIKSAFGLQTFKPTGGTKVSSNIRIDSEINGSKIAGGKLREDIISTLKEFGVKDAAKQYADWAKVNKLKDLSAEGLQTLVVKDVFGTKTIGAVGSAALGVYNPLVGVAAYFTLTPYGNQILRESIKEGIRIGPIIARAYGTYQMSNFLSGGK